MEKHVEATDTVGTANQLLNFGEAIKALNEGRRVQRLGWNGKGLFIFRQVPSQVHIDMVPKMTSLPQSVKDEFIRRKKETTSDAGNAPHNHTPIRYQNQIAMVYPDNNIYSWAPSVNDAFANDWVILD